MFDRKTFLGASIKGINSTIGWNGNSSQLTVSLVEDTENGDSFTPTSIGQPVYCEIGNYVFYGLLEKYTLDKGATSGINYNVICVDPSKLIDNTKLILNSYNGTTYGLKNILNVYGFLENVFGFGGSQSNATGIPWKLIRDALLSMTNAASYGLYGGPITYKGYSYSLDLSELPGDLPDYFRISGDISVLDFIKTICEYSNHDFFVELQGLKIKIRTVSRYSQPSLGVLSTLIASYSADNLIRSSAGIEARNEVSSAFLTGGEVTDLWQSSEIVPFYGLDFNNNPVTGTSGWVELRNSDGDVTFREETYYFTLDASVVSDILGNIVYHTSEFELRIIGEGGDNAYSSWMAYIQKFKPDLANRLNFPLIMGLNPPIHINGFDLFLNDQEAIDLAVASDLISLERINIERANRAVLNEEAFTNLRRLFNFLKKVADTHLGKTFMVRLPFVLSKTEAESGRLVTSYEVTDQGFLDETVNNLDTLLTGPDANKSVLLSSNDGRYPALAVFYSTSGLDITKTTANDSLLTSYNDFFLKVSVNPKIYFIPEPAVIITLPIAAKEEFVDNIGMLGTIYNNPTLTISSILGAVGVGTTSRDRALGLGLSRNISSGNVTFRLSPKPVSPSSVHIPLKSNIATYGPWYAAGVDGNVRYEQDNSLVPWNYGGIEYMNLAAEAKVTTSISNTTEIETGYIEVTGLPLVSLGDVLQSGGPNVTDINISYNTGGVSTTYRFSTYVPRFGHIGKYASERLRSTGLLAQSYSRNARETVLAASVRSDRVREAQVSNAAFMAGLPRGLRRETPHNILFAKTNVSESGICRYGVSSVELGEALFFIDPTGQDYNKQVFSTMNCLLAPVSIYGSGNGMSQMEFASGDWGYFLNGYSDTINSLSYNPYRNQGTPFSTDIFTWGNQYPESGINTYLNLPGNEVRRVFATKGPILLSSWGADLDGNAVPGNGVSFSENWLVKPQTWKTGPVDLLWDNRRKVWTSHDIVKGVYSGYNTINVVNNSGSTDWNLRVNFYGFTPTSGQQVFAAYLFTDNKWYVLPNTTGTSVAILPTGETYTVFHTTGSGTQEWSRNPNISSIKLGGPGPTGDGYVELARNVGESTLLFCGDITESKNIRFYFPPNTPSTGQVLTVTNFESDLTLDLFTEWTTISTSGNSNNIIPTGDPYTLFYTNSTGVQEWSSSPYISTIKVGGSEIGSDGYIELGKNNDKSTRLFGGDLESSGNLKFYFPNNIPSTGQVLTIKSFDNGETLEIFTEWLMSSGIQGEQGIPGIPGTPGSDATIPTGEPYTLFHTNATGSQVWSDSPTIFNMTVGGSGIGVDGYIEYGRVNSGPTRLFGGELDSAPIQSIFLPYNMPATGDYLRIESFSVNGSGHPDGSGSLELITVWDNITSPTGLTKTFNYISSVMCSGSSLVVQSRTMTFVQGLLQDES